MSEKTSISTDKRTEIKNDNRAVQTKNNDFSLFSVSPVDRILFLQRTIGNQGVKKLIQAGTLQAKIKIEHPDNELMHVVQQEGTMTLHRSPSDDRRKKIVDTALGLKEEHYLMGAAGQIPGQGGVVNARKVLLNPDIHGASIDVDYGKTRGTRSFVCGGRANQVKSLPEGDPRNPGHNKDPAKYKWLRGNTFGEACEGKRHFDCGGFVSYCYHQACPEVKYPGPASALLTDASGFRKVEKKEDIKAGDIAYRPGHAGLCVSNDRVVSALGRVYGITEESTKKYTTFGFLSCLDKENKKEKNEPLIKSGALQAKLMIGTQGDVYEQEADMVAEQVMRMPAPAGQKSDISRVRMHSGAVAGQSARNMNAFPGISSMLLSSLLLQRFAGHEIPLTAGQVAAFRSLAHEVAILIRSGALVAEETAAISTAVAEAETAIVATESVITTVVTATTAAEGATVATAALAVDDVTIIGAADDVALPFTIIAAVVGFGVGFGVGYIYRNEIAAAAEKVGRAVNIMRRILANHDVAPNPNTQQQTKTETQTQTKERKKRRKNCFEYNPGAVPCDEPVYDGDDIRDEIVAEWLMQNGYDFSDLVNCSQFGSPIGAGEIEDCGKAPAIRYHCQIKGTRNVVSIFACLCCDVEGNSRFQWSRPHWSINQSRRSQ